MPAKNPFPGMNPWLEDRWGDVHSRLVGYAADQLQDKLPDDLRARMQQRVFVESPSPVGRRTIYPDVEVYEGARSPAGGAIGSGATSVLDVADPLVIHVPADEVTEPYLEIIDARSGGRVVTAIEFVSRPNKAAGPGRDLYLQKQRETVSGGASLVEVDLLRGGEPVTLTVPDMIAPQHRAAYHVSVRRASRPMVLYYYPAPLRQRLPVVAIPLRPADRDVPLDIQALVDLAYARGRYDDIDYAEPPRPALSSDDAAWAAEVLKSPDKTSGASPMSS